MTCDYCLGSGKVWVAAFAGYDICPDCFGRKAPADSVIVTREQLKRWASALDDCTSSSSIIGDGRLEADVSRAGYAAAVEIETLLKGAS